MRLFVALNLPTEVRTELEIAQRRLQHAKPHPVKWVTPMAMHLTLQFLGEVKDEQVPDILAALRHVHTTAAHATATQLHLSPAGAFPHIRRPQTIWMGVGGNVATVSHLHQAVATALEPLGFAAEERPFRAHVTLGRVRREATSTQRADLGQAIASLPPPSHVSWSCGLPVLFQSTLTPTGSIYQKLGPA